jgi:Fe2+ or Zn2+ uptake regulation protein
MPARIVQRRWLHYSTVVRKLYLHHAHQQTVPEVPSRSQTQQSFITCQSLFHTYVRLATDTIVTRTNLQESVLFHSPNPPLHNTCFCCTCMNRISEKDTDYGQHDRRSIAACDITALSSAVKTVEAFSHTHTHTNFPSIPPSRFHGAPFSHMIKFTSTFTHFISQT